ncbi:MAG: D-alanyl-D-alanine carboxypeptidase [Alphaproteobacteria bacterium]|nr:D-alanyl-D-alanine carboxypeptidase [Alphaproteobacteria bacterium]MBM3623966.1 D-alanyl-D-alanine carboxypeptidase [Alphaproteobacteria bacterium]
MIFSKSTFIAASSALLIVFGASAPARAAPSIVVDVASGAVLSHDQATASWYPASLTKLMTAYVALDAVRQGRISLDTPVMMSPRACRMAPSKMGFRPGSEVTLHNALVMLMVKSANDIAVAIAEGVSGSVEAFADEMNRASASLGMTQSVWVNPNGLPDDRQVTSARDLAILGRALYVQFPEHANLFNIGAMQLGRQIIPTHNQMLGRYPGADGMKTGFTCPAGFNLVASATRGGRRLIAVVLGAPNPMLRTAKTAALLDRGFQSGAALTSLASLPNTGPTAAPDMREAVCHHRGPAAAAFMAEIEEASAPVAATGIPLLDTMSGAQQQPHMNAKEVARLPRPRFEAVSVYVGRAPGYIGPVARTRAPGAPVGEQDDLSAYASQSEPGDANASPISKPAPDAVSLRRAAAKHARAVKAARAAKAAKAEAAKAEAIAAEPSVKPKTASATKPKTAATRAEGQKRAVAPKPRAATEQGKS